MRENIELLNSKKKKKLSNEDLSYFQWELRSFKDVSGKLLVDYPMSGFRNKTVLKSRMTALDCILSNITNGPELIIPNFSKIRADELGFSRQVLIVTPISSW